MSESRPHSQAQQTPPTIQMTTGWHCLHIYYRVNPVTLSSMPDAKRQQGIEQVTSILSPGRDWGAVRIQTSIVSGHHADLGVMMMDPDPLKIDAVTHELRASLLGTVLEPTYSFVSITEISEYVPTVEQFSERLRLEGLTPGDAMFNAKVKAYEQRLPAMNQQRIYPEFPAYPVCCFYPMNKIRDPHANWYTLPFSERSALMAEHATSGIKFAGKVSQLITASTGYDEWEWGVTLWSRAPEYIKDIVYGMRFDQASARYAGFGPFYISYVATPADALAHLRIRQQA